MLSQIVIEAEGLDELRLRVDTHLIAENLTAMQAKLLVCGILDRIDVDVFQAGNAPKPIQRSSLN